MSQPVAPAAHPLPADDQVPAAVAPQDTSPEGGSAATAGSLSTASLTASIAAQLRGEKPTVAVTPGAESGTEPSPGSEAGTEQNSQTIPEGESGEGAGEDEPQGQAQNMVGALAQARQQKRELKQELAAKENVIVDLQAKLLQFGDRLAAIEGNGNGNGTNGAPKTKPTTKPTNPNTPPELAEAEAAEAQARDMKRWSSSKLKDLNRALAQGQDTAPMLAALRTELPGVTIPESIEATQDWLETLRENADEQLADLRVDTRVLRRATVQDLAAVRRESDTLMAEWVPELKDQASPRSQKYSQIEAMFPQLMEHHLGPRMMASAILGWEILETRVKGKNGHANGANGRTVTPATPGKPTPRLPGASSGVPPRTDTVMGPASHMDKMKGAKTPEELAAAKEGFVKSLAASIPL